MGGGGDCDAAAGPTTHLSLSLVFFYNIATGPLGFLPVLPLR